MSGVEARTLSSSLLDAAELPAAPKYRAYGADHLDEIAERYGIDARRVDEIRAVAAVLPFRVNRYVLDELIDWDDVPDDPIYRLTFPQPEALRPPDLERMLALVRAHAPRAEIAAAAHEIRMTFNPHPSGQLELNRPAGEEACGSRGLQHKYAPTVLFFPGAGQTCHAYCSYCFRWPQFVGEPDLKFAERDASTLTHYLRAHPEVSDVLITGGDPLIMKTSMLARYVEALLAPALDSVRTIRIGTKAPAYWPHRLVSDRDADALLALFERVVAAGRQLAVMIHYSHPRELSTATAQAAVRRVLSTGARIYCQAPLIRGINDAPEIWSALWTAELRYGCTPYYMFVERDTGPQWLFDVPLVRAHEIFSDAYRTLPGLARTVRGPVMSATPGKVVVDGIADVGGERVFCLRFLQARRPSWVGRPFFARFDPDATWLSDLVPAGDERSFFFQ
ncbi:MAG: KamA family radical SAM protein [Solirubrobacteraceae bacterium]